MRAVLEKCPTARSETGEISDENAEQDCDFAIPRSPKTPSPILGAIHSISVRVFAGVKVRITVAFDPLLAPAVPIPEHQHR